MRAESILKTWNALSERQNSFFAFNTHQKNIFMKDDNFVVFVEGLSQASFSFEICKEAIDRVKKELKMFLLNRKEKLLEDMISETAKLRNYLDHLRHI